MRKWVDFYEQPYAEDDLLLNKFIEDILHRVSWKLFENQENVVYMAYETDSAIPKMREGAIDYIREVLRQELSGWMLPYMLNRILISYLKSNIEPSEDVKYHFNEDLIEYSEDFWNEIDDYIWNDYAKQLGEARTAELWEKWGKAPRKEN